MERDWVRIGRDVVKVKSSRFVVSKPVKNIYGDLERESQFEQCLSELVIS